MSGNTTMSISVSKTDLEKNLDQMFVLIMAMLIQLMQCGFAFLEVGCVKSKNTSNILMKTLLDAFVAGVAYWGVGYALAYGHGNRFIGWTNWASSGLADSELPFFFLEFVIASTASTIVSGAVAERCEMVAYLIYSFFLTGFVYPVISRWIWSTEGWLYQGQEYVINGVTENISLTDFSGSGAVHLTGGTAAFFAALILGPRIGRFHRETKTAIQIRGHSMPYVALGDLILLIGFLAFNGGSQMSVSKPGDGDAIGLSMVNTVISASTAAYTTLLIRRFIFPERKWSILNTVNGSLAGMVAICSGCNAFRPWGGAICGIVAGIAFNVTSWLMCKLKIDDPVDAVSVHFAGGAWGVLSVAFLKYDHGILMNWDKRSGLILAWQITGVCSIIAWTGGCCAILFSIMKYAGIFRVSKEMELKGLDIPKHGEPAYPLEAYGHGYQEKITTILENGQLSSSLLGYVDGNVRYIEDTGLYETPEVKVMNNLCAKFIPEEDVPISIVSDGVHRRVGQINAGYISEVEKTAM